MEEIIKLPDLETTYRAIGGCEIEISSPCCLVVFGAYGDLAKGKLIPSLYLLSKNRLISENFFLLGIGRQEMSREQYFELMRTAVKSVYPKDYDDAAWSEFAMKLYYSSFDFASSELYIKFLKEKLPPLEKKHQTRGNRIFYLATPPSVFGPIILILGMAGLSDEDERYRHVCIEKRFGRECD